MPGIVWLLAGSSPIVEDGGVESRAEWRASRGCWHVDHDRHRIVSLLHCRIGGVTHSTHQSFGPIGVTLTEVS